MLSLVCVLNAASDLPADVFQKEKEAAPSNGTPAGARQLLCVVNR
jgi:hypothetical protein